MGEVQNSALVITVIIIGIFVFVLFMIGILYVLRSSIQFEDETATTRLNLVAGEEISIITLENSQYLNSLAVTPTANSTLTIRFISSVAQSDEVIELESGKIYYLNRTESFALRRTEVTVCSDVDVTLNFKFRIVRVR